MALQKQLVHLNFNNGLQRKDDEKLVIPTKLTVADNVEFDDKNTIIRRGGQASYGSDFSAQPLRLYEHNNGLHVELENGLHVKRLSASTDYYFSASTPTRNVRAGARTSRVQGLNIAPADVGGSLFMTARAFDVAQGTTTYCLVWEDTVSGNTRLQSRYSIRDYDNNELYAGTLGDTVSNYNTKPRVMWDSTNSRYVILFASWTAATTNYDIRGTAITQAGVVSIAATTVMTANGANTVASNLSRDILFDASLYAAVGFVVAARGTDSLLSVRLLDLSLSAITGTTSTAISVNQALTTAVTYSGSVLTGHVFYDDGNQLIGRTLPSNTGVLSAASTISTATFSGADIIGRTAVEFDGTNFIIVADVYKSATAEGSRVIGQNVMTVSTAHVLSTQSEVRTDTPIAGRIFTMRNRYYIPVMFDSYDFQRVLLVMDVSTILTERVAGLTTSIPSFIARIAAGEVASYTPRISTTSPVLLDVAWQQRVCTSYSNMLMFPKYDGNSLLAGTVDRTPVALNRLQLSYNDQLGDVEFNGLTYLAGAMPLIVDGQTIAEEGFHWAPESADNTFTAVASGSGFYEFPTGFARTYNICFTYAWEDSKGNWHESAPSKTYSITTTALNTGISGRLVTPPTQKQNAQLFMYRTLGDSTDTTMYLAHSVPLAAGVTMSEANLVSGEVLYTEGGVLPNNPMPACRQLCLFQRRLVAVGVDDGRKIVWSKQSSPGFAAEFSNDLAFQTLVPDSAGRAVGAVEVDDRLVIVCESSIGTIYGQGPAATGTQGQYSDFTTVVGEMGALWSSPKSIIKEEAGVWFQSPVGLRLFARGGGLARGQDGKHVGSEVDDLTSTGAPLVAVAGISTTGNTRTRQQIRFCPSGTGSSTLVWDTHWLQWTRFTGTPSLDARCVDGTFWYIDTTDLNYFSDTLYTDFGNAFTSTITTGWLSFAGIQGFQRLYRLMLTGDNTTTDPQTIAGTFTYDFSTTTGDSFTTNQTPNAAKSIQIQHHMAKQKCEAMKISITFQPQTTSNTGRLRLTDLTLQVGVKPGYFKLPSASRV